MPCKQGIVFTCVVILLVATDCGNSKGLFTGDNTGTYPIRSDRLVSEIYTQNLGERDFEIGKLKLRISENGNMDSFNGFLKHNSMGEILLSVRTIAGIEALRVHMSRDSIRINDRIYRKYSHGSTSEILSRFGFEWEDIGLLFGDIVYMPAGKEYLQCEEGYVEMKLKKAEKNIRYRVDCKKRKLSFVNVNENESNLNIDGQYTEYQIVEELYYPGNIVIKINDKYYIDIEIQKLQLVKDQVIRFSIGKGYETNILR